MRRRKKSGQSPIGVNVSGRMINAVQLAQTRRGCSVTAATSIHRSPGAAEIDAEEIGRFAGVLDRQGFSGRQVVVALPSESVLTAVLELPPRDSGAPLDQIARVELASAHKCNPDTIESAFWELPQSMRSREGMSAMAVGCRHDDADALLDAFEDAGLTVIGLDVKSCAVARACGPALSRVQGLAALLNIEWSAASLVVLSDDVVVYERSLANAGLERLHESLVRELDLDLDVADYILGEIGVGGDADDADAPKELLVAARDRITAYLEAMMPEIRMSLGYATQEYGHSTVDRIVLIGEAAAIPGLVDHLTRELGVETITLAPSQLADCQRVPATPSQSPVLTAAFGLAQYPER
jgi:type IV pilus assembly protein PilM